MCCSVLIVIFCFLLLPGRKDFLRRDSAKKLHVKPLKEQKMGKTSRVVVCGMAGVGKTAILEQLIYGNITPSSVSVFFPPFLFLCVCLSYFKYFTSLLVVGTVPYH